MVYPIHDDIVLKDNGGNNTTIGSDGELTVSTENLDITATVGDINLVAGDDVTITADSASALITLTVGDGGTITLTSDDDSASAGGSVNIKTGDNTTAQNCGSIEITAGDASNAGGGNGGAINIYGGDSEAGNAGDINILGGAGTAASVAGGDITIAAGTSGAGAAADVELKASNGGAAASYLLCDGSLQIVRSTKPFRCDSTAEFDDQVDFDADVDVNSTATFSGTTTFDATSRLVFTEKTLEGSPTQGEVCQDTLHDTLAYYNGSFWQNATPLVYRLLSTSDTWSAGSGVEDVFQLSAADIRYTIPADSLRAGNIIRVKAMFVFDGAGSASAYTLRGFVGPNGVGSASDTTMGTASVTSTDLAGVVCVESDMIVRSIGAGGALVPGGTYVSRLSDGTSATSTFTAAGQSQAINTTGALYVYFSGELSVASTNDLLMQAFTVEIL